jgi:hypothetical protein
MCFLKFLIIDEDDEEDGNEDDEHIMYFLSFKMLFN